MSLSALGADGNWEPRASSQNSFLGPESAVCFQSGILVREAENMLFHCPDSFLQAEPNAGHGKKKISRLLDFLLIKGLF